MSESSFNRPQRPLKRLPSILVGGFLSLYALFFAYRLIAAVLYPYPIEYGEGAVLYETYHLALGDPYYLYKNNATPPYRAAIYTPLYYYTAALPMGLTQTPAFAGGRVLSGLAALLCGWLIYRAARIQELSVKIGQKEHRIRLSRRTALAAAVLPFATGPVYAWGALYKPDMLAVALSLAAVFVVFLYIERSDPRDIAIDIPGYNVAVAARLGLTASDIAAADYRRYAAYVSQATWAALGSGGLCALAIFAKQSALAAPVAIFFFLALREKRLALYFAVAFTGLTTFLIILFQFFSQGQFFTHIVSYNGQNYELEWLFTALNFLLLTHPVLLLLPLLYIIMEFRNISLLKQNYKLPGVWSLYFLAALLVTFSVGKVGANLNYYIELLFVASLLSWWFIAGWLAVRPKIILPVIKQVLPLAGTVLVLMFGQLILLHHVPVVADGANTPGPAQWQNGEAIAAEVRRLAARGPMLAEDSGWLAVERVKTDLDDAFVFGQLAQGGQWSQPDFLHQIGAGYYKSVLLELDVPDNTAEAELDRLVSTNRYAPFPGRFSPEMLALIQQNFVPEKRLGKMLFLIFKPG